MNYEETLAYLYNQLPMFTRVGASAYKKDLHNTLALCAALDNPHQKIKTIHVAGTNGKGSTCHMLASILQEAGYKTGLYTSPHIKNFGERIRINGAMISEQFVVDFVEKTKAEIAIIQPSFFELTVAMAFDYFAQQKIDIAVIETGLGGRLDSTNVIQPMLSVICNIGYDHMNLLGDSLEKIAAEKAGIIKKNTPVVIGKKQAETETVFRQTAERLNSHIVFAEDNYKVLSTQQYLQKMDFVVKDYQQKKTKTFRLDLTGDYQRENLCTILCSLQILQESGMSIPELAITNGLAQTKKNTGIRGRWEVLGQEPMLIVDVAHNEAGIRVLLHQINLLRETEGKKNLHCIMGFAKDKDLEPVFSLLPKNAQYYFSEAHIPRALSSEELRDTAKLNDLHGEAYPDVNLALAEALSRANKQDIVVVCGSFYLIAELDILNE